MTDRIVHCQKLDKDLPGLPKPPYRNELGQKIFEHISQEAWNQWLRVESPRFINTYRWDLAVPAHQKQYMEVCATYFGFKEGAMPETAWVCSAIRRRRRINRGEKRPAVTDVLSLKHGLSPVDLYQPEKLAQLYSLWDAAFRAEDPAGHARFAAYRACAGAGMSVTDTSQALLVAAPHVSRFVAELFGVHVEVSRLAEEVRDRSPLWRFKRDFVKKRLHRPTAGTAFKGSLEEARSVTRAAMGVSYGSPQASNGAGVAVEGDEEGLGVALAVNALCELDDVARKASKAGGVAVSDSLRARGRALAEAFRAAQTAGPATFDVGTDSGLASLAGFTLDAFEADLAARHREHHDPAHRWASLRAPKSLDFSALVQIRRPYRDLPEVFVGPEDERREREGFKLTDGRKSARAVEQEIDYCLYCHERDKDSCSKGLRDNKTREIKKNPLGVGLSGCPLDEKISEMHVMRRDGDTLAALALVTLDNPMCAGTGHRICNDCMKACVFQKQEPVNIPEIETRVLSETLALPWGAEIYGFLTRWNPLNVKRPHARPYNGKNVLVVGLGPAGYTLAHHLTQEGFGVVAVDGLKIEPLNPAWLSKEQPIRDYASMRSELDERILLGFGGVSEYGITVRWDKNFLTLLYATLARNPLLRIVGGVRFGGTLTLDDAFGMGFHHVALAAGAGRPTIIDMKNNLARGIRKASDFLMALQLTGAYKRDSIANLEVDLPAIVIGGGLTAIDTATELLAYYPVQVEKLLARVETLVAERGENVVLEAMDPEERATLSRHLEHARAIRAEKAAAAAEKRQPRLQALLDSWGGVTLVYRKSLGDSPAYRLNHEEVEKSLEEGIRYAEHLAPQEACLDEHSKVRAVKFTRPDGSVVELPARTVCVAAGTSPNVTYEREYPDTLALDDRKQYFQSFAAEVGPDGQTSLAPRRGGFFTSYLKDGHTVSFYGDNHPTYAGSVVKAMASAKDGFPHVRALFPELDRLKPEDQGLRDQALEAFFAETTKALTAEVVAVNRLTETIVEVVVRAPAAARKFLPGQFYRLQNFETLAPSTEGTRLAMEGLAMTGAWTDPEQGLLGTIVLEMGGSSSLCASLKPGEPIILMGPTGAPTHIAAKETVLLCGGGLGNAVLFSIARAFKALGSKVIYFAGYKRGEDLYKQEEIEKHTDQVIWATDAGKGIEPRRPSDVHFRGNIVQAMLAYGKGELHATRTPLVEVDRIIAIGSDRMMAAVKEARHGVLQPLLNRRHLAIGSINSPMQCMMKEICAQCLQKHVDPATGKEHVVFSCFNQDQELDRVNFDHLRQRLRANSMQEKVTALWLDRIMRKHPEIRGV